MPKIDELFAELGFEFDPDGVEQFQKGISGSVDLVKKLTGVVLAASAALVGLVVTTSAATDEQGKLADQIGISVEELDAWQHAAGLAGGSAEGMASSMEQLAIRASEAARGTGSGVEAFGILGVSALDVNGRLKSTTQLMLEVSGAMQGLDRAQQIELADKLGLRDAIRLLQTGPGAIRDTISAAKELGTVTEKDASVSANFNDALADTWRIVRQISRVINRELAPILTKYLKLGTEWWRQNRALIEQKLPEWIETTARVFKILLAVSSAFIAQQLVTSILALIKAFRGLSIAALIANAAIAIIPTLIAAGVAGIALLAQDANGFFNGMDSAIGSLIERFPEWRNEINIVAAVLATLWDLVVLIVDGWRLLIGLVANFSIDNLKQLISELPGIFGVVIDDIKQMFFGLFDQVVRFGKEKISELIDKIKSIPFIGKSLEFGKELLSDLDDVKDKINSLPAIQFGRDTLSDANDAITNALPFFTNLLGAGNNDFMAAFATPVLPTGISNIAGNTSSVTRSTTNTIGNVTINVEGAGDPREVANEINRQLQQSAQNVSSNVSL